MPDRAARPGTRTDDRVDILVHCAGAHVVEATWEITDDQRCHGVIVGIASIGAWDPGPAP